ncbi:isoprenyl transferase [Oceanibacterium hippocampi]|uniref:Isoprenyl transferase n=1 Tax=Oceanibacterium hippocampi TaxID=745714 RepID=A0A1Y5T4S9_9PROT|nr:isoprenyl transferase [Oceanibacterium hippocampi]SLN54008.1 Ditrans,polycis-undecaprenyl-diphosphate synthase ((2E,6E)-farnesyl-diphosphate specific) [Oceanibacterium hippocampi]
MSAPPKTEDRMSLPRHVAIIMDGNGRWAKARGLPRTAGHKRGADAVRNVVVGAREIGIDYLTLYAFSSENWKRPASEVDDLMGLLRLYLSKELAELHENGVRVRVIGERDRLAPDIVKMIAHAEELTAGNRGLTLAIALNYGGQNEIVGACRSIAARVGEGALAPEAITPELFAGHLQTAGMPDPDMLIRTSGERRLSNFLLWQCAYAEFFFVDTLWPDFGKQQLEEAVHEFSRRERRYGASSA